MTDPQMIGHYRVVTLLGTGAMGKVHAAVDTFLEREVAIKSLRAELTQDPDFVSRFRAEATSLAKLNHPNITTLYSPVLEGNDLYMVMELVHGRPLDEILRERGKPLGVKESLAVIAQAADGLAYAHQMGVIHRDIKPSNLMVADDGRIKIMDFGIARVRGSVRLTRAGTAVGTPLYMSPEQCRGGEGDERSDLYALAVVLYEMLAGAPPFSGATEYDLTQAQIHAEAPPLVPRISGVTPEIESAIMTALAKRPEQRYPNMRAFSDALGATALRIDAASIVRNAGHLVQDSTAERDVPTPERMSTKLIAIAKSRSATVVRRFKRLHPAAQGASLGVAAAAVATLAFLAFTEPSPPERQERTTLNDSSDGDQRSIRTVNDAPIPRRGDCNSQFATPNDPLGCNWRQSSSPKSTASIYDLRAAMKDRSRWDVAFPMAQRLAEAGDKEAQYYLGTLYAKAPGHQNFAEAFNWFRKSAAQGYADAQASLGVMYKDGLTPDGRQDPNEAVHWFELAEAQNNGRAQFWLGEAYEKGLAGLSVNRGRAEELYYKASLQAIPDAAEALQRIKRRRGRR
ncbi:MAG: serine/threonine-protein kinase [Methylocystis sp.]|uniref:serine/threonine-protein kinase n=1 Tax=Methylocystis sp. TaxID=1911079 RepID=UPI003D0ABE26